MIPSSRNEGVKTIEAELERALFEAGAIAETNYGFLQKSGWSRAGRTDKGVHAVGQMVTAKLHVPEDVPGFLADVNARLPDDIRIMHMVTTTKNFNAKMSCDKRTYEYLAPSFMFAPRDIVTVEVPSAETTSPEVVKAWSLEMLDRDGDAEGDDAVVVDATTLEKQQAYRMSDETYTRLLRVLKEFEGTHNFHNFTSKLEPSSPKCQRYIMAFGADKPFVENGMEWIRLRVLGQSFLLHHIRKMIGTACEVVAGTCGVETIAKAFELDKMDLPKAPSVGLYMAQAHFEVYNNKLLDSVQTSHPPLDFKGDAEVCARIEQFKKDFIFEHILAHEQATRSYAKWIKLLSSLPFDYVARPLAQWKKEKEELSAIQNRRKRIEAEKAMRQREAEGDDEREEVKQQDDEQDDGDVSE
jgi:tRNA pseudouridine38-40 synthase